MQDIRGQGEVKSMGCGMVREAREAREAVSDPVYARARETGVAAPMVRFCTSLAGLIYLPYLPYLPMKEKEEWKYKGLEGGRVAGGKRILRVLASLASRAFVSGREVATTC